MTVAVIFAGPTLPPQSRPPDPRLHWRPPVQQGDVYRVARARPAAIGIVDGYFEVVPTVWHKEILWAMAEGARVYGSASIGALRAAELEAFGMRGVGWVYEAFRDAGLEDDEEVALLHGPEELGYPALTEAMVNIRATVAAAAEAGVLSDVEAAGLTEIAKALFYKERTYDRVFAAAQAAGFAEVSLRRFADWLPHGRVDRKRQDALAMLDAMRADLAANLPPLRVTYALADTAAWQLARRRIDQT